MNDDKYVCNHRAHVRNLRWWISHLSGWQTSVEFQSSLSFRNIEDSLFFFAPSLFNFSELRIAVWLNLYLSVQWRTWIHHAHIDTINLWTATSLQTHNQPRCQRDDFCSMNTYRQWRRSTERSGILWWQKSTRDATVPQVDRRLNVYVANAKIACQFVLLKHARS